MGAQTKIRWAIAQLVPLLSLAVACLVATNAQAALQHEYTFNDGTACDCVGSANGTLRGNAKIAVGSLVLDGTPGTFVDLLSSGPDGININTYTSGLTLEVWATPSSLMTGYDTLLGFGQVNTTNSGLAANYFTLQTHRGDNVSRAAIAISNDADPFTEEDFANGPEYNDNKKHYYAAVLTNTSISLYTDGTLRQTATVPVNGANNMISGISTEFARIGSSYPFDPLWQGTVGNIRIYDSPLTALQIIQAFSLGATIPIEPTPTLTIDRGTGTMLLTFAPPVNANRCSLSPPPPLAYEVVGYSITSAAGSLNPAAWLSIADHYDSDSGGSFDNNNKWTKLSAPGSKTDFSEFEFDGGDGGAFGAGGTTSLALGSASAWRKSIYEDLQVQMRLNDGTSMPVSVVFTGNGFLAYKRSDLNFDGVINISDWNIFLANNGTSFPSLSAAESYALGDLNGDLVNDLKDFRLFKSDYSAVNGAGAFDALGANVPEPSTLAMLALVFAALLSRRAHRGLTWTVCNRTFSKAMHRLQTSTRVSLLTIAAAWAALAGEADAALVHRYSFDEGTTSDATGRIIVDSVGGANGVVRGAGASGTVPANGVGGQLTLAGGPSATAAYVDLPNGIISSLTDATFDVWYTISTPMSWGRVFDFGSTDTSSTPAANVGAPGELLGPGGFGNGQDYLFYAPQRGTNIAQQRASIANQDPAFLGSSAGNFAQGIFSDLDTEFTHVLNQQYHADVVFNSNGAGPGQPTEALYINGVLAPQQAGDTQANPLPVAHQLANLNDVNNWLGRSNWTQDMNFAGSFNEFRIYDNAFTAAEVALHHIQPDPPPPPEPVSLTVNTVTGQVTMKNLLSFALTFDNYQLTSAGGALSTAGWTGIDGDTAPGTGWDKSGGSSANQLTELYLPAAGYILPANGEISIGNAFNPAVFGSGHNGDLAFGFGLLSGAFINGTVNYIHGDGLGDYNGDGIVDAADYTVWRDHLGSTTFALPNDGGISPGVVDMADYNFWKSHFNTSGSGALAALGGNVPEPAAFVIVLNAIACLTSLRLRLSSGI